MSNPAQIERDVEVEGTPRESPWFPIRVRERKLRVCQETRGVAKCKDCQHYEPCELVKAHLLDVRFEIPKLQKEQGAAATAAQNSNPWLSML